MRMRILIVAISLSLSFTVNLAAQTQSILKVWIWGINISELYLNLETGVRVVSIETGKGFNTDKYTYVLDWSKANERFQKGAPGVGLIVRSKTPFGIDVIKGLQFRIILDAPSTILLQISDIDKYIPAQKGAEFGKDVWFDVFALLMPLPETPEQIKLEREITENPLSRIGNKSYMPPKAMEAIAPQIAQAPLFGITAKSKLALAWGRIKS